VNARSRRRPVRRQRVGDGLLPGSVAGAEVAGTARRCRRCGEVDGISGEAVNRCPEPGAGVGAHLPETKGAGGLTSLSHLTILCFSPLEGYYSK
jgi:hypothetical protein